MEQQVRVGFLGCGTVGAEAVRILVERAEAIHRYTGIDLAVAAIAVRDPARDRGLDPALFTADAKAVVEDPDIDVVVEVMGGLEPTEELVAAALESGKPVVTANKELIAKRGGSLLDVAERANVDLLFEAAVGGGIPLIRPITESLAGEDIRRVIGIVNGTTNYILTRMTEEGGSFDEILADAQHLGYAEADPSADVDGHDAAQKAAILASLAFGTHVHADDVHTEGIRAVRGRDIGMASRLGYVVKLLAVCEFADADAVSVRVHPAMLPATHPLAGVRLSMNAVFVEGVSAGEQMFYGAGAGGGPTAIAVVGDVVDAARNLVQGARGPHVARAEVHPVTDMMSISNEFYVRLEVMDEPGVLATIAGVFGGHGISIKTVIQEGREADAEIVLITHPCEEAAMQATLRELRGLEPVEEVAAVLRVLGEDEG
ncbi:MAG: homoserine dehydrogenase [Acidimicrobiia bacterium]|nr:homoserine dehydrogenase [Acidimicrobiia bacterium]